jgi:hypothetical protein
MSVDGIGLLLTQQPRELPGGGEVKFHPRRQENEIARVGGSSSKLAVWRATRVARF